MFSTSNYQKKKWIVVVKLKEIKFSIFLNFFDVILMFFSMFCRSMFHHRSTNYAIVNTRCELLRVQADLGMINKFKRGIDFKLTEVK